MRDEEVQQNHLKMEVHFWVLFFFVVENAAFSHFENLCIIRFKYSD